MAEPFGGTRWGDGGVMTGGSGQNQNHSSRPTKLPGKGLIKGTSGPQLGQPQSSEGWSPSRIGTLMDGDNTNVQSLFDNYARNVEAVCLEDFTQLCRAHGCDAILDESSLATLMQANGEFIFYEGEDAHGLYWTPTPFAKNGKNLREFADIAAEPDFMDDGEECVCCGGEGCEACCPEDGLDGLEGGFGEFTGDVHTGDEDSWQESIDNFFRSAHSIVEHSPGFSRLDIGEALNYSWDHYAGRIDARKLPTQVKKPLSELVKRFPRFSPLTEANKAMEKGGGSGLESSQMKQSPDLADQPDDFTDAGHPYPSAPKNAGHANVGGVPGNQNSAGTMGESREVANRNVTKLSRHVNSSLRTVAKNLKGKYGVVFSTLVREGKNTNATPRRRRLAEALADTEEILQLHGPDNVLLEATFVDENGREAKRHEIALPKVAKRGPLTSNGGPLFRFKRNAEAFANKLVSEGTTCRVAPHSWGYSVIGKLAPKRVKRAYNLIRESAA